MYNKYRDDPKELRSCNADIMTFRPTFVIDEEYDDAFCEEEYQELRVANTLMRQVGPCQRCKTTTLNWRLNQRHHNNEPFATIN